MAELEPLTWHLEWWHSLDRDQWAWKAWPRGSQVMPNVGWAATAVDAEAAALRWATAMTEQIRLGKQGRFEREVVL